MSSRMHNADFLEHFAKVIMKWRDGERPEDWQIDEMINKINYTAERLRNEEAAFWVLLGHDHD